MLIALSKRFSRLAGLVALAATTATMYRVGHSGRPKLMTENLHADVGRVVAGEVITHSFLLANRGPGVLRFGVPKPACGCTSVKITPDGPLGPGAVAHLTLEVRTDGLQEAAPVSPSSARKILETATITTNERGRPEVTASLSAEVVPEFLLSSSTLLFGSALGLVEEHSLIVTELAEARVLTVQSTEPFWRASILDRTDSGARKVTISIATNGRVPPSAVGNILITTSSSRRPKLRVLVMALGDGR
jgi:hypothetical protein